MHRRKGFKLDGTISAFMETPMYISPELARDSAAQIDRMNLDAMRHVAPRLSKAAGGSAVPRVAAPTESDVELQAPAVISAPQGRAARPESPKMVPAAVARESPRSSRRPSFSESGRPSFSESGVNGISEYDLSEAEIVPVAESSSSSATSRAAAASPWAPADEVEPLRHHPMVALDKKPAEQVAPQSRKSSLWSRVLGWSRQTDAAESRRRGEPSKLAATLDVNPTSSRKTFGNSDRALAGYDEDWTDISREDVSFL